MKWKIFSILSGCMFGAFAQMSCSVIDDDLSDCGSDYQLDYELRLVTNMTTELQTELTTQTDLQVASALRGYLNNVFTDFAHDVDLSFYDTQGDSARLQHDEHIMNANQASYTLYLPMRQYMHLAAANVVDNPLVEVRDDSLCHDAMLAQIDGDTIASHTTGLFTARHSMEVLEGIDQTFNVHLYMVNCATALVVDTVGSGIRNMRVVATGFATGFRMADSVYVFHHSPVVRAEEIAYQGSGSRCFATVNFPSRNPAADQGTRLIIETTDPFVRTVDAGALWEYRIYAEAIDGSTTETVLSVGDPLRAGQLRIIKCRALADGSVVPADQRVGVSITLNWNIINHGDVPLG